MSVLSLVFVYGTLKSEEPNHSWLLEKGKGLVSFIGNAETVNKYPLVIGTKYNIPFLLDKPGSGKIITGEVYEVDNEMLSKLDILEDHPNYYVRRLEDVCCIKEDTKLHEPVKCWTYFLKHFKPELLQKEMFSDYRSNGSHGLPYCERYRRDAAYNHKIEVMGE